MFHLHVTMAMTWAYPAMQWVPWTRVVPQSDGSVKITGPMGNVLDLISNNLQFEYVLVSHPTSQLHYGLTDQ